MPRRKLIRPAEPLTPPEPGSLEETIYLGDCASAFAKPLAQLRWYDRRGELQMAIQNRNKSERIAELEKRIKELEDQSAPPVAVPPVPTPDVETERRVNKMLKDLESGEAWKKSTPVPEPSAELKAAEAERDRIKEAAATQAAADRKAAEDSEKKALAEKKAAKIQELKESRDGILKRMSDQSLLRACVDNPALGKGMSERLDLINKELDMLEGRRVATAPTQFGDIVAEQRRANAESQREYQRDWEWQMSGCQTTRPTNFGLFRDED